MAIKQNDFLLLQGWQKWWDSSMMMRGDDRWWIRWYFLSCPVAVLPTSMSACCLACLPLWQPLVCLSVILSACVLVCLVFLPVCHLLPSLYCSPLTCLLLLRCLPVCLPAVLLVCLSVILFVCYLSCLPSYLSCLSVTPLVCLPIHKSIVLSVFLPDCCLLSSSAPVPPTCLACWCPAYQYICQPSYLSVFMSAAFLLVFHPVVCLLVCLGSVSLLSSPIFLLQPLLPVLPVAVLPTFMSACHLACLSFCYAACLSASHPDRPSLFSLSFRM
jgi:hypothetical protein